MAMNFFNNYEEVSKQFVNQYYQIFDDPNARPNLANFYQVSSRFAGFEFVLGLFDSKFTKTDKHRQAVCVQSHCEV